MAFNPYLVKISISTGSKGKRHFDAGRVKMLKNEWKQMGLNIVSSKDADYVVIPDGSQDKGRSGRFATPIHYSDFLELVSRYTRPSVKQSKRIIQLSAPSASSVVSNTTPEHRIVRHDLKLLERRLRDLSDRPLLPPVKHIRLPVTTKTDGKKEKVPDVQETVYEYEFVTPFIDFSVVQQTIEKLKSIKNIQEFINSTTSGRMYPTLYSTKQESLNKLREYTLVVLTFWQELRVNLQVVMAEELPPRIDINTLPLCDVPTKLGLPYDLTNCWTYFFTVWSNENSILFTKEELISNLTNRTRATEYFWAIETNLYILFASIQCAQHSLQNKFIEWVKTTREGFRVQPRCGNKQQCNQQFCIFHDEQCHEKPVMFVLEELVIAFCGSSDLIPISQEDYQTVNRLYELILDLHEKWYDRKPEDAEGEVPTQGVCSRILTMVNTMMATLKEEMQLNPTQDIFWSDLMDAIQPNTTLATDWSTRESAEVLKQAAFGDTYRQRVLEIGKTLLQL